MIKVEERIIKYYTENGYFPKCYTHYSNRQIPLDGEAPTLTTSCGSLTSISGMGILDLEMAGDDK